MPILRCQRCDQAYDVPSEVAVRLPSSLARCRCGDLVFGIREVIAARWAEVGDLEEIDLAPYRTEAAEEPAVAQNEPPPPSGEPKHLRVVARGAESSIDEIFTIDAHPLIIGRRGAHVELDDAELSIRHCEIFRAGNELRLRDCDSHTGTFLDGEPITEAVLADGMHLVRAGNALVCVESTDTPGRPATPIALDPNAVTEASPRLMKKLLEHGARSIASDAATRRRMLVGVEGPVAGREYDIPREGLIVGREGDVRVADEFLSRKHFSISPDDQGDLRVKDLGSRNGTFLNSLPARNTRVRPGDQIRAGITVFRVEER